MAVAVAVSAHADHQRQQAIEHITELVEKLHDDALESERSELDGCQDVIDKATAVLLDHGKLGASLGLDSAVHAIGKALRQAHRRAARWTARLDEFGSDPVELGQLVKAFPGINSDHGELRTHLELAALAIALRRRVIVLQAVEHSQADTTNPFGNFVRSLDANQQRVDELEKHIASVLLRLSSLELRSPGRLIDTLMTRGQVTDLLQASYRLRDLGPSSNALTPARDVFIDIAQNLHGSLVVLPAVEA